MGNIKKGSIRNIGLKHTVIIIESCSKFCAKFNQKMKLINHCRFLDQDKIEVNDNFDVKIICNLKK